MLSLVVTGLLGERDGVVQASYVAAAVVTRTVVVPLCLASLVTGVVQSMGTPWGLARHYWVLVKLVLTVVATFLLLLHTRPIELMADVAARGPVPPGWEGLRIQLLADAGAALLLLLGTTALAVLKPRGLTRYGRRRAAGG